MSTINDPIQLPPGPTIPPIGPESTEGPSIVPLLTEPPPITDSSGPSNPPVTAFLEIPTSPNGVVLPLPEITLNQFIKTVTGALNDLRDTVFAAENQNNMTLRNMHLNALIQAADLARKFSASISISHQEQALYESITTDILPTLNIAIETFNDGIATTPPNEDQQQINLMNQAISEFNAGTLSFPDFVAAANSYNDYANSRNLVISPLLADVNAAIASYNAQVAQVNATIDQINLLREQQDLPPSKITHLPTLLDATTLPLVDIPPGPGFLVPILPDFEPPEPVPNPPAPDAPDQVLAAFNQSFDAQIPPGISLADYLEILSKYREFVQTVLQSRVKIQPNGYVEPLPATFFSSGGAASAGAGVSLSSIAINLDTRGLESLIGTAIFEAAALKFSESLPPRLLATLVITGLKTLSISGLMATIPAMRLVANKLPFINEDKSATDVALGLNYSTHLSNLIASDDHLRTIQGFVRSEFPGLNEPDAQKLATALTAGLNLSLLQFATFELAQTLGIPGLSAQLIASDSGQPVQDIIQEFRGPTTVADTFQNPISIASLKANLADQLASSSELSVEARNSLVNSAVNHANAIKESQSAEALQASLLQELIKRGINETTANNLALQAANFLKAETLGLYLLDTEVKRNIVNKRTLIDRLTAEGIDETIARDTATNVQIKESRSLRNLRDRIAQELVTHNVSRDQALIAATKAVIGDQTITTPPILPQNLLAQQISEKVVAKLSPTMGVFEAQNVANQVNVILFGTATGSTLANEDIQRPTSIRNQLIEQINVLNELHDEKIQDALQANFRDFNKPNFDLYTFNRRIMDPANTLILSIWTGAMYKGQGTFPSNYQKTVDVII